MLARRFLVVLPWITKIVIFERFIWKNKAMIDNFLDRVQTPIVDNFGKSQNFTKKKMLVKLENIILQIYIRVSVLESQMQSSTAESS